MGDADGTDDEASEWMSFSALLDTGRPRPAGVRHHAVPPAPVPVAPAPVAGRTGAGPGAARAETVGEPVPARAACRARGSGRWLGTGRPHPRRLPPLPPVRIGAPSAAGVAVLGPLGALGVGRRRPHPPPSRSPTRRRCNNSSRPSSWSCSSLGIGSAVLVSRRAGSKYPSKWDARIAPIATEVAALRGLTFEHPVAVHFLAPADFEKTLAIDQSALDDDARQQIDQAAAEMRAVG